MIKTCDVVEYEWGLSYPPHWASCIPSNHFRIPPRAAHRAVHWRLHGAVWRLRYPYRQDLEPCLDGTVYGTGLCRIDRQKTAVTAVHTVIRRFQLNNEQYWVPKIEMLTNVVGFRSHYQTINVTDNDDNDNSKLALLVSYCYLFSLTSTLCTDQAQWWAHPWTYTVAPTTSQSVQQTSSALLKTWWVFLYILRL
jgi:hypothetical protein